MKQIFWAAAAVLILFGPAYAEEAKLVGYWRAEYVSPGKEKPMSRGPWNCRRAAHSG